MLILANSSQDILIDQIKRDEPKQKHTLFVINIPLIIIAVRDWCLQFTTHIIDQTEKSTS